MTFREKIFKSGFQLGFGQVFSQGCSFLRNVIVARLVTPADFGIAATFAMTLSLVEMVSSLATEKLIIQSREGDEDSFQATVQMVQAGRGVLNGLILFALASPISHLFGVPEATWAFQWVSLIPVLRGLMHQDINRMQREMKFGPSIFTEAIATGTVTVIAYPLGKWLGNYATMLWIILLQSALGTIASHWFAERKYRWTYSRQYMHQIVHFGWPLLINGLLMFGILQGDRFIIGSADRLFGRSIYSMKDLGIYSVCFALTFAPTMLVANVSTSLMLPLLAGVTKEYDKFLKRFKFACETIALISGVIAIPLIGSGDTIVRTVYGAKYTKDALALVGWLAAMQSLRILRIAPTLAAMAYGDTKNAMYSNVFRSSALIASLAAVATGRSIIWIAISGFLGELIAFTACILRLQKIHKIPIAYSLWPSLVALFSMAVCGSTNLFIFQNASMLVNLGYSASFSALYFLIGLMLFNSVRKELSVFFERK